MLDGFPTGVAEQLKSYVYRLIDPRNGETFYVGKGIGNRIFAHVRASIDDAEPGDKLSRIHQIHAAGFEVAHVIHRHGMNETTAYEVESALIDAYPGLTNIASGAGSEFGAMHAQEIVNRYQATPAEFVHRLLLINVNRSAEDASLYDATRYAWKISPAKARKAEFVLAVRHGMIIDAFTATDWLPAERNHFPEFEPVSGRYAFIGERASEEIRRLYVNKRVPDEYRKRGAANPIRYINIR